MAVSEIKLQTILTSLRRIKQNRKCIDCGKQNPQWASVNNGIILCLNCSGKHRRLGVHISAIRSLQMDTWTQKQLAYLKFGGNHKFASFLGEYDILHMEPEQKYATYAADYYRRRLKFLSGGGEIQDPPPTIAQGANFIEIIKPVILSDFPKLIIHSNNIKSAQSSPNSKNQEEECEEGGVMKSMKHWAKQTSLFTKNIAVGVGRSMTDTRVINRVKGVGSVIAEKSLDAGNYLWQKTNQINPNVKDLARQTGDIAKNFFTGIGRAVTGGNERHMSFSNAPSPHDSPHISFTHYQYNSNRTNLSDYEGYNNMNGFSNYRGGGGVDVDLGFLGQEEEDIPDGVEMPPPSMGDFADFPTEEFEDSSIESD